MPFTFTNYQPGNINQSSPYANLIQNAMANYQNAFKTAYTPQIIQSEIFHKQFAPLAEIATSPLAEAMLPEQRQQMMEMISRLLGNGGGSNGGLASQNMGDGSVINQGGMGSTSSNTSDSGMPNYSSPSNNESNPNLPSSNFGQSVREKTLAPYGQQLHPPGEAYVAKGGKPMVASSGNIVAQGQQAESAINVFNKLAPEIIDDAKEFTGEGSSRKLKLSQIGQTVNRYGLTPVGKLITDDPDMAGRYDTLQGKILRATDQLKLIYPNANTQELFNRYVSMLEVRPSDTQKSYSQRVRKIMDELQTKAIPMAKKMMGGEGGYSLQNESPSGTNQGGYDAQKFLSGNFKSAEEFKEAFRSLSPQLRGEVRQLMQARGMA